MSRFRRGNRKTAFLVIAIAFLGCARKPLVYEKPQVPVVVEWRRAVSPEAAEAALQRTRDLEITVKTADDFEILADDAFQKGRFEQALSLYRALRDRLPQEKVTPRIRYMVAQTYLEKGDNLAALSAYEKVIEHSAGNDWALQARRMMEFAVRYILNDQEMEYFLKNYPSSPVRCTALLEAAKRANQGRNRARALEYLWAYESSCKDHEGSGEAALLKQVLDRETPAERWKIALLAPLSGPYQAFGEAVRRGALLALEEETRGEDQAPLIFTRDTQGDPVRAVQVFQAAVEEGVDVVFGPVLPSEIAAVAPLADRAQVVVFVPTANRRGVGGIGRFVFAMGFTPAMQGERLGAFAAEKLGLTRLAALFPEDPYGEQSVQAFTEALQARGATLSARIAYDPSAVDFKKEILALGGNDPAARREKERLNQRVLEEMKFHLERETTKALLALEPVEQTESDAAALLPFVEALGDTTAPSFREVFQGKVEETLKRKSKISIRSMDFVVQALSLFNEEAYKNTRPVKVEEWRDLARELKARVLVTGEVRQEDEPSNTEDAWKYRVTFEAYGWDPKKPDKLRVFRDERVFRWYKEDPEKKPEDLPQAVFLPAHAREAPLLAAQIAFYRLSTVLLGGHLWHDPAVVKEAGQAVEGMYVVTPFDAGSSKNEVQAFLRRFEEKYAEKPDWVAAQSYDAARALWKALQRAKSRGEIPERLWKSGEQKGVTGSFFFDETGEVQRRLPILKVDGGSFVPVEVF